MCNFHILYLDNDSFLANQVKMRLEWKGYHVKIANNEQTLLTKIHQHTYDLLIIDLFTPSSNTISLLEHLKERRLTTPTILVSDKEDHSLVNKAMYLGCIDYVLKAPLFQGFCDRINLSIFQIREKKHQQAKTHNQPLGTLSDKLMNWEYFPLKELIKWSPEQSQEKIFVPYDEFTEKIYPDDLAHVKTQNNICLFSHKPVEYSFRYLYGNNPVTTYQIQIKADLDAEGIVKRLYGNMQQQPSQQHSDTNLRLKLSFLDNTADAVFITNSKKQIVSINHAFTTISGYSEQEILKKSTTILSAAHFGADFFNFCSIQTSEFYNTTFWVIFIYHNVIIQSSFNVPSAKNIMTIIIKV